jgi:hypothetical protein
MEELLVDVLAAGLALLLEMLVLRLVCRILPRWVTVRGHIGR